MFILLAEETDRIAALTLYMLQRAIDDNRNWRGQGIMLRSAVNIFARLVVSEQCLSRNSKHASQSLRFPTATSG